jgi:hypothetical protein
VLPIRQNEVPRHSSTLHTAENSGAKPEIEGRGHTLDRGPLEPLSDECDLLVYAKNGNRPQLLEHLAEVFPRHAQIHYGRYRLEELCEAARRARACAYLADDDHSPLALQEILLAGCPVVGVRTGAPFIQNGVTGMFVDRLPPGAKCVKNEADETALATFVDGVQPIQQTDHHSVRARAVDAFATACIVDQIIQALIKSRSNSGLLVECTPRDNTLAVSNIPAWRLRSPSRNVPFRVPSSHRVRAKDECWTGVNSATPMCRSAPP